MTDESAAPGEDQLEAGLAEKMSATRLEQRLKWASILLLLSALIPYEVIGSEPLFIWQALGELSWAARIAAFSLSIAGAVLFVGTLFIRDAVSRAVLAFACFAGVLIMHTWGAEAAAWDTWSLPESLGDRPGLLVMTFASAGAGIVLVSRPGRTHEHGKILLFSSAGFAALVYLIPTEGIIPARGVFELLWMALTAPDVRLQLGYGMLATTALLPVAVASAAVVASVQPPRREGIIPAILLTYALPIALGFFAFRHFMLTLGGSSAVASALGLMPLVAALGLASASLEVLGTSPWPQKKTLGVVAGGLAALAVGMFVISRPPAKGVEWKLGESTEEADALFRDDLRRWNRMRRNWGRRQKTTDSQRTANQLVHVRKSGSDLIKHARTIKPALAEPMNNLVFETQDLDLAGRRWFRLVGELNERNRTLGLPYYVDPEVDIVTSKKGIEMLFDLESYRVEKVRPWTVDGVDYATVHVRALGKKRRNHSLLGFSRDFQPFALVALDVLEPYGEKLITWAESEPPACFEGDPAVHPELGRCGEKLREILQKKKDLIGVALASTERHELQHQIDGPGLPIPSIVYERMGPYASWARTDVNRELSAHLAEFTAEGGSPYLDLIQVWGNAYNGRPHGKYTLAAVMVLEGLVDRELDEAGTSNRARSRAVLIEAFDELMALPENEIRRRAKEAWRRNYGDDLPEVAAN